MSIPRSWGGIGWRLSNIDGAGQAPGPVAAGVVIHRDGLEPVECYAAWPEGTHNQAEYRALILGLQRAFKLGLRSVEVLSDSMLVVEQVNCRWKCKDSLLANLRADALDLLARFDSWELRHIGREDNKQADKIAGVALQAFRARDVHRRHRR